MNKLYKLIALSLMTLLIVACHHKKNKDNELCSVASNKSDVLSIMQDWYLWNDLPNQFNKYNNINLAAYTSVEALLDYLRYEPTTYDRFFSYITTPQAEQSFLGDGEFVGLGFSMVAVSDPNDIRFAQVFENSPAADAGFQRGFKILEINDRTISAINAAEGVSAALGPSQVGVTVKIKVANINSSAQITAVLVKRTVTLNPAPLATTFTYNGGADTAGYILFNSFIGTATQKLRDEFAILKTQNIRNLIVDLRYNGGGYLSVADVLAGLLGGSANAGNIFYQLEFNASKALENNRTYKFIAEVNALDLNKIIFITGNGSASASELVINSIKPYFNVPGKTFAVLGDRSYGKPVGQIALDFCQGKQRMRVVAFKSINVQGYGDYFSGLPVDCPIADDFTNSLGNPAEAVLSGALTYLETSACPLATPFAPLQITDPIKKAMMIRGAGIEKEYAGAH